MAVLALSLAYFALLDGWYLVRVPCAVLRARLLQPRVRDLLAEQSYAGRVLPSDLDLLLHMNNARYLREADVARAAHLARCGVLGALRALGARAVLAASCARYRRSLRLLEPFEVRTRLLGWDDRAFYLEARFISLRDGFVCALLRSRQHVLGTSPERVVQHLCKHRVSVPLLRVPSSRWTPGIPGPGPQPWGRPAAYPSLGFPRPASEHSALSFGPRAFFIDAIFLGIAQGPQSTRSSWTPNVPLLPSLTNLAPQGSAPPPHLFRNREAQSRHLPRSLSLEAWRAEQPHWSLLLDVGWSGEGVGERRLQVVQDPSPWLRAEVLGPHHLGWGGVSRALQSRRPCASPSWRAEGCGIYPGLKAPPQGLLLPAQDSCFCSMATGPWGCCCGDGCQGSS